MSGEKTEKPTEEKLRKSAEKGQVAQRKNVVETGTILFGCGFIIMAWDIQGDYFIEVFSIALADFDQPFSQTLSLLVPTVRNALTLLLAFVVGSGVFGLFLTLLLNKFNFAPKALTPKFEKLNPVQGLKNIFSLSTLYNFLRLLTFFSVAALIIGFVIWGNLREGLAASYCGLPCLAQFFPPVFVEMISLLLLLLLILAAFDYRLQNALHTKQNKMSKDDTKREHKDSDGDPHIKGQRSNLAYETVFLPGLPDVTNVVYCSEGLIALVYDKGDPDFPPFVVLKARAASVERLLAKFQNRGVKCIHAPDIWNRFAKVVQPGGYVGPAGAMDAATILHRSGDI